LLVSLLLLEISLTILMSIKVWLLVRFLLLHWISRKEVAVVVVAPQPPKNPCSQQITTTPSSHYIIQLTRHPSNYTYLPIHQNLPEITPSLSRDCTSFRWSQPRDRHLSQYMQTQQPQRCKSTTVSVAHPRLTMRTDRMETPFSRRSNHLPKCANFLQHSQQSLPSRRLYHVLATSRPIHHARDQGLLSARQARCALYKCPAHLPSSAQEAVYDNMEEC
jgi:hypothetical protein